MAIYQGPFATSLTSQQTTDALAGQRPESWREMFLRLYPNTGKKAPLTALTARMKSKELTEDALFHWFEKDIPTFVMYINNAAGYAAGITSLLVDDGAGAGMAFRVRAGHQIRVERTGEIMWVVSDPTLATTITVVRAQGTIAAAPLLDNDVLTVLGTVHGENSGVPTAINYTGVGFENCAQIFREPINISGTANATKLRTGSAYNDKKLDALEAYSMQQELAYWFSQFHQTSGQIVGGTGLPERSTGGIFSYLISNNFDAANFAVPNTVSVGELETSLEQMFRYGSAKKVAFCGSGAILCLQQIMRIHTTMEVKASDDKYGLGMRTLVTPFGELELVNHPLFSVHPSHRHTMAVVDLPNITYRYMKGRDTKLLKNRQNPGVDGLIDEFLGETGLEVHHEKTHGVITNMVTGA